MAEFTLTATPRPTGKKASKSLRRLGQVPAILYGPGIESEPLAIDRQLLARVYAGAGTSHLVDVQIEGRADRHTVLIKDLVQDPVRGTYEHVDLYRVPMDRPITSRVPLRFEGRDRRPNDGGIVVERLHAVEVRSLPTAIPEAVVVDVSNLGLGENLLVRDLKAPEGVEILDPPDELVVSVLEPSRVAAEETPAEETEETASEAAEEPEA